MTAEDWLAVLTAVLCCIGVVHAIVFALQAKRLRQTVESAERASMPFLYPQVRDMNLHPPKDHLMTPELTHQPAVRLGFVNFGKTPAVIRRVGAQLFLVDRDDLPQHPPDLRSIPSVESAAVVPAEGVGGARVWPFERQIAYEEMRDLARDTKGPYKRFYIMGYVVYDDFFDVRHTKRFCLKVRQNGFQAMRGRAAFHTIERIRIEHATMREFGAASEADE